MDLAWGTKPGGSFTRLRFLADDDGSQPRCRRPRARTPDGGWYKSCHHATTGGVNPMPVAARAWIRRAVAEHSFAVFALSCGFSAEVHAQELWAITAI